MTESKEVVVETLPHPPDSVPSGAAYIGMSNTRGVLLQVHLQRFQYPLLANITGLAGVGAWLSSGEHSFYGYLFCSLGCGHAWYLNVFLVRLLKDTTTNLIFWSQNIVKLVFDVGIKDHLAPGTVIDRPRPKVTEHELYRILKRCSVAWGVEGFVSLSLAIQQIGGIQWLIWKMDLWLFR